MATLAQNVTEIVRDWILHGTLAPGEHLEEIPLAARLGVSRTPLRTALASLAAEGLLDHQPNRGYLVRGFDLAGMLAAYEVRAVLEGLACRNAALHGVDGAQHERLLRALADGDRILAAGTLRAQDHAPYQQMNVTIHDTLLQASGNEWVRRFAEQAQNIPFASDRIVLWDDHALILRSHGDHHRIIEAVRARDAARAEALMREHVFYAGVILQRNHQTLLATRQPRADTDLPRTDAGLRAKSRPSQQPATGPGAVPCTRPDTNGR